MSAEDQKIYAAVIGKSLQFCRVDFVLHYHFFLNCIIRMSLAFFPFSFRSLLLFYKRSIQSFMTSLSFNPEK